MIEEILSEHVTAVEAGDGRGEALFPAEESVVARSSERRRRDFTTGRVCAHAALAELAAGPTPLLPGPRGEPRWPAGIVGSITHCPEFCAAAAARSDRVLALGIDAEPNLPLPADLLEHIALPEELAHLAILEGCSDVCWDRLLFSVKEAVYKAWFPLVQCALGFHDTRVTFSPLGRTFVADLRGPRPEVGGRELGRLAGRWLVRDGLLLVAVEVRRAVPVPRWWPAAGAELQSTTGGFVA